MANIIHASGFSHSVHCNSLKIDGKTHNCDLEWYLFNQRYRDHRCDIAGPDPAGAPHEQIHTRSDLVTSELIRITSV